MFPSLKSPLDQCVMWVNLHFLSLGLPKRAVRLKKLKTHFSLRAGFLCYVFFRYPEFHHTHVHNLFSVLASLLFASFSTKTSVKKKTVLSDRGKAIENRYAFSTNAMKRRKKKFFFMFQWCFRIFFLAFFTSRST